MPAITYHRPWLYAKQRDALFGPARFAIVEATTKSGKSAGCMVWLFEQAAKGKAGQNYWWVAPVYQQARMMYGRFKRAMPRGLFRANDSQLLLTLNNGTLIWFRSAEKPDNLYGEDVYGVVIDEATRCREEAWHAIRSTLTSTRGPARIIGNVKGRKNWAYHFARRAEAGEQDTSYAKITAHDAVEAGIMASAEVEDARRQLPLAVFRELYLAEPSDDEGNPFGLAAIRACVGPLSQAAPLCWGWDLAKSVDWTVGVALDAEGHVCRVERWQSSWQDTLRRIRQHLGEAPALVDSTGVGDPIVEQLAAEHVRVEGFKFTAPGKQQLMEGLAVAIQQGLVRFPEGVLSHELETFEYEFSRTGVRYTAPVGLHDDGVCALALAWSLYQRERLLGEVKLWHAGERPQAVDETARREAAAQAVLDGIARDGWFGPSGVLR